MARARGLPGGDGIMPEKLARLRPSCKQIGPAAPALQAAGTGGMLAPMDWFLPLVPVASIALWLGWRQLAFIRPGLARELLSQGAKVIDVRGTGEFQSKHLSSAINIPLDELRERIAHEVPNQRTVLLLHCAGGVRSAMGVRILKEVGYAQVYNLGSYGRAERILQDSRR
jgi:phage shock protein E